MTAHIFLWLQEVENQVKGIWLEFSVMSVTISNLFCNTNHGTRKEHEATKLGQSYDAMSLQKKWSLTMTAERLFFSRPPGRELARWRKKNLSAVIVNDYTFFCNDIVIIFELRQNNSKQPLFCCHCLKSGHWQ